MTTPREIAEYQQRLNAARTIALRLIVPREVVRRYGQFRVQLCLGSKIDRHMQK